MPINTTRAYATVYATLSDASVTDLVNFTGATPNLISDASRAVISVYNGNAAIRWDNGDPEADGSVGVCLIGLPATGVFSNAVVVVDGGFNVNNLKFIGLTGDGDTPFVSVVLEGD